MNQFDLSMNKLKKKFQEMGFGAQDPVINHVLGIFSMANLDARSENDMNVLIGKIEQLVNMDPEVLMNRLKVKIGKMKAEQDAMNQYYEEKKEDLEIDSERRLDEVQENSLENAQMQTAQEEIEEEQELFLLDRLGRNPRLQVREELEERNLQDRQKALMERSLKILEALEKIKQATKGENGILEIGGDIFKGMNSREIKQQLGLLKAMGVQEVSKDDNGNILENEGREIAIETLTEKDMEYIEKGEIELGIPLETLRSIEWMQKDNKMKEWFKTRDISLPENETTFVKGIDDVNGPEVPKVIDEGR